MRSTDESHSDHGKETLRTRVALAFLEHSYPLLTETKDIEISGGQESENKVSLELLTCLHRQIVLRRIPPIWMGLNDGWQTQLLDIPAFRLTG